MKRRVTAYLALSMLASVLIGPAAPAAARSSTVDSSRALAAPGHALIEGDGSSWSANALNQWISDVSHQGMQVVYTSTGSAQGRSDYRYGTNDFAISDIGFQGIYNPGDPLTANDTNGNRPYVYLPIVAGGTSLPYQIRVGGQLVRNLRLSGQTIAKIFTGVITNWSDPQITSDNNGRRLPSLQITPVVHSEGSGASFQFTAYLATEFPSLWHAYAGSGGATEFYPPTGANGAHNIIAENGSDGVINFVTAAAGNGAIGYDEYSYALNAGYPVAKVLNANGYFTLPTDFNVAVALTSAIINMDTTSPNYLLQDLHLVYGKPDNRTYPLSSYSYMILPVGAVGNPNEPRMTSGKRQTLADFMDYSLCTGQHAMGPLGYSPLPINLVQASFDQVAKLAVADPSVVISAQPVNTCNNPTFVAGQPTVNHLAQIAPMPAACDQQGAGPCSATTTGSGGGSNGSGSGGGSGSGTGTNSGPSGLPGSTPQAAGSGGPVIDQDTGQIVNGGNGNGNNGNSGTDANAIGTPNDLAAFAADRDLRILAPVAALLVLAIMFIPAVIRGVVAGRRRGAP
jgi:ABC-type phosphate transport system substrate-binding protein